MNFPDPRTAGRDGLLCVGGNLSVETLLEAYSKGIFPWPQEGLPLLWFSPWQRGVLDFSEIHWPRRFLQEIRSMKAKQEPPFRITFNRAFEEVIRNCAAVPRTHESGTWILPAMERAYVNFHKAGYAVSVECWRGEDLVGGLYGVYVKGVFSGESMFHKADGASKRCLYELIIRLRNLGLKWMDIQMVTPVLETFGGKYILRDDFLDRLRESQMNPPELNLERSE